MSPMTQNPIAKYARAAIIFLCGVQVPPLSPAGCAWGVAEWHRLPPSKVGLAPATKHVLAHVIKSTLECGA